MKGLKISPTIEKYTHHDYKEPELRKLIESGKSDLLDLTYDADEIRLVDIHSLIKPFLTILSQKSLDLVKYFDADPLYQDSLGELILSFHEIKKVKKEQVFFGNGAYALFKEIVPYLLDTKGVMIGNGPQFPDFPSVYTALGGKYRPVYNKSWNFPVDEIIYEIKNNSKVSTIFIDVPSNATGNYLKPEETKTIIEAASKKGIIVIVDEAYSNYLPPQETVAKYVNSFPNLIIIRSLSKAYDLGGIRFGYAIMSEGLAKEYEKIHSPFEPAVFSVLMAEYIFKHGKELNKHLAKSIDAITTYRQKTIALLKQKGIHPIPSHPNMPQIMFYKKGENLFKQFLDKKIVVRSGKMYQFTCPEMDDQYVRLRPPLTDRTFKEFEKRFLS